MNGPTSATNTIFAQTQQLINRQTVVGMESAKMSAESAIKQTYLRSLGNVARNIGN